MLLWSPGRGWAARLRVAARTQGQREGITSAKLSVTRGAAGAHRPGKTEVGLDPCGTVCIHVVEENSFLEAGALSFAAIPAFSAQFSSRHGLASSSTMQNRGYMRGGEKSGKNTRVFQAPTCFSNSHRPPQRRTTGLRDPESCLEGRAERSGFSRPQAGCRPRGDTLLSVLGLSPGPPRPHGAGSCRGRWCAQPRVRWSLWGQNNLQGGGRGVMRSLFGAAPGLMSPALEPRGPS